MLVIAACLAATGALYAPTLRAGFTTWDDADAVLRNQALWTLAEGTAGERLTAALALFHPSRLRLGDYAPVAQLSLALDLAVGKGSPVAFHAVQLLLHLVAVGLVLAVARRLGAGPFAACIGAFLFAVHPVQVEPVTWISCRGRLLASVFGLLAVALQLGARPRSLWAALCLALGILSKISALAFVLPVLLAGGALRRQLPVLAVAVCSIPVLLVSRLGPASPESLELGRLFLLPDGLACYLHLLAVPSAASVFHALDRIGDGLGWGLLPGALAVGVLLALAPSRPRRVAGALLGASVLMGLVNVIARFGFSPVADRYLYEPLAALAWLVATARIHTRPMRVAGAVACLALAGLLLHANLARQQAWMDPIRLWADASEKYPASPFVWLQLGSALETAGDPKRAESAYRNHLERRPDSAVGHNNLARALTRQGRLEEAVPLFDRALELDRDLGLVWFNRGEVLLALGRREEALGSFERAVELEPSLAEAYNAIGVLRMGDGELAEAQAAFEAAIRARPERPNAHYNLARLLARQGHLAEAEHHYLEAIQARPSYKRAHNNLGLVYLQSGRVREAIAALERALEIDPNFEKARLNLGNAYLQLAVEQWATAASQNPAREGAARQLERLRASGLLRPKEAGNEGDDTDEFTADPP